jgi:hypothetical protein
VVDLTRDPAAFVDDGNSGEFHYIIRVGNITTLHLPVGDDAEFEGENEFDDGGGAGENGASVERACESVRLCQSVGVESCETSWSIGGSCHGGQFVSSLAESITNTVHRASFRR